MPPGIAQPTLSDQKWFASAGLVRSMAACSIARRIVTPGAIGRASGIAASPPGLTAATRRTSENAA